MDPDELDQLDDDALPLDDDDDQLQLPTDEEDDALPPEGGEDDGAADGGQQPQPRQRTRGENRFQRLSNENRDLRARLDALERGSRAPQQPSQADRERADAEERERVALMSPDEQARFYYEKGQREFGQQLGGIRAQMQDQADSAKFEALCARNPTANQLHDEVERQLANERRAGNFFIGREGVLRLLLGDRALKRQRAAAGRQRQQGRAAVDRERVAPPRQARQAAPADRNTRLSEREQRRKRLENVTF